MRTIVGSPVQIGKVAGLCLGLLLASGNLSRAAEALSPVPENNIQGFYATLLTTMKSGAALGESGRYAQLAPVVQRLFDVSYMTQFAVGPSWASLTPEQREQVVSAFGHYVAATYAYNFDSYSGERLQVLGERPFGDATLVQTRIVKSNGEPVAIDYLMRRNGGMWQINDIYLDGTISQLAVRRSEFTSILQNQGVGGLISTLNRKVIVLTKSSS